MKPSWEHEKETTATDQKFRNEDEHLREIDKRHLKQSEGTPELIPTKRKKGKPGPGPERDDS